MRAAIAAVRANTMTKYRAAKVFKVPRTTLHDYLKNDRLPKKTSSVLRAVRKKSINYQGVKVTKDLFPPLPKIKNLET